MRQNETKCSLRPSHVIVISQQNPLAGLRFRPNHVTRSATGHVRRGPQPQQLAHANCIPPRQRRAICGPDSRLTGGQSVRFGGSGSPPPQTVIFSTRSKLGFCGPDKNPNCHFFFTYRFVYSANFCPYSLLLILFFFFFFFFYRK